MSADPMNYPRYLNTVAEYIELEQSRDERFEYWDGAILCPTHCSLAHKFIASNVCMLLANELEDRKDPEFTVMNGSMRIKTPLSYPYKYPDGSVTVGEMKIEKVETQDCLVNPILIFEINSIETDRLNRGPKFATYKGISSFCEYLMISESESEVTYYLKQGGKWQYNRVTGIESSFYLSSVDCTLHLKDIYHKVYRYQKS